MPTALNEPELWPKNTAKKDLLRFDDILVFFALEILGTLAITGNLCLIVVLLRNKYLHRARFLIFVNNYFLVSF